MAFIEEEDMSFDLVVLVLKDGFVKLLIVLLDVLVLLIVYYNIEYRVKRGKSFSIKAFKNREEFIKSNKLRVNDELLFIKLLKDDLSWNDIRFKTRKKGNFIFDYSLIDCVSNSTYNKFELDRIPLIIFDDNKISSHFMSNLLLGENEYVALLIRVPSLNNNLNFSLTICKYECYGFKEIKSFYNINY